MAVASVEPYANFSHFAPTDNHHHSIFDRLVAVPDD